jgi:glycosyltransferase involved in cell wall biosynthesis
MKVGILGHGFIEWGGGIDFVRMVAESLISADPNLELHFLFPIAGPMYQTRIKLRRLKNKLCKNLGWSFVEIRSVNGQLFDDLVTSIGGNSYAHRIDIGMSALRQATKKYRLDVLLPSISPLKGQDVPWIGYLYDYQHAYYPEFFTPHEIAVRNAQFQGMLKTASHVIVNAKAVAEDIKRFNPEHQADIIALPFSAAPNPKWLEFGPADLEKHGILGPYFIISNQFWQHKDHITAWHGLALVLRQNPDVQLVCTGEKNDYRNPGHFSNLMQLAEKLGIMHQLKILGLIPKDEQIRLICSSVAMLQPSLFEGGPGGGAVFDAISLGVPCIVSDVQVNRELNEPSVTFFKARDPASLAEEMLKALDRKDARARSLPADLIALGTDRRQLCGKALLDTIGSTIFEFKKTLVTK